MADQKTYTVEFTAHEWESLKECLHLVRKHRERVWSEDGRNDRREAIHDPVFRAASELVFKLVKIEKPDTKLRLQDFLEFGSQGLNN